MQSQAMGNGQLPLASCQSDSHSIRLSDLVRLFLLVSVPPKALSPSHQPRLPGLLHWPSTRNAFMLMGISYSLNITNTAVKSTTYRHLLLLLLIFIASMLLLPTSLDTPSFSPSAMNSLSTDCIVLTTCFSNSSSCIHTRCQQSPPAPPRSHQDCTWAVMVIKIAELLPSCSPA